MASLEDGYSIGQLAKLSGVPVKTIRFYSDAGVLPERDRTAAGYRLYGEEDLARLELIRTLREVGVNLATIRTLAERDLRQVLALQLRAVETQLTALQRTRAVLRATLERGRPSETDLRRLNSLGRLGAAEREALMDAFVAEVGGGNRARERWLTELRKAMVPELPAEPTIEQFDAWLELAELLADEDYRASLRKDDSGFWERRDRDEEAGAGFEGWREANGEITRTVLAAIEQGVAPESAAAVPIVDKVVTLLAGMYGAPDPGPEFRRGLSRGYEEHDPRATRHWELVAKIQGTPWPHPDTIAHTWIAEALRAHPA
ncbi:MerR family transcriptional regulator [Sphaerisporangium melleum]|uniref:MerR family transcriptional regulator n=1 Tax=Sphaerisporangium melleum TaxID=321316 RepID=A0A917QW72_9ACTN|nr:MerR family transcriptional regulator [Sphaerisporangium melleum]GGK70895.1 MerR family transcriptional regulator [Sphaerisporangium melleum]GII70250.1 MerR family transcriptional regulator [Sphaerisporangium melleum]